LTPESYAPPDTLQKTETLVVAGKQSIKFAEVFREVQLSYS
jgi:hypothetical protein